jgi:hypothetical protein
MNDERSIDVKADQVKAAHSSPPPPEDSLLV